MSKGPIPDSYWLIERVLLAGEYPGAHDGRGTRDKLARFLDAGILTFIDLTESQELTHYADALQALAEERGLETKHIRYPIRDISVPKERAMMTQILTTIRAEIAEGRPVYVHCWGGIGRTGTVIGCWLVEEGVAGPEAIERIAKLREPTPDGWRRSPETDEQCRFICEWSAGASG